MASVRPGSFPVIIPPKAIATAGTYIVTLKSEGEVLLESRRAHLVVGLKP